jgi:hypothetical protein
MGIVKRKPNEVLLRVDSWSIERSWEEPNIGTIRPEWFHDNGKSFIKHECPGERAVASVYVWANKANACWRCQVSIPDGIKGAWIMHNWEELQSER